MPEAASPVRLVRPWPDHFSAGCSQTAGTIGGRDDWSRCPRKLAFTLRVRVSRIFAPALLPADQEPGASRSDCIRTYVMLNTDAYSNMAHFAACSSSAS